jgi:hypothetical protein
MGAVLSAYVYRMALVSVRNGLNGKFHCQNVL